jgi:hypothetical protein
LGSLFLFVLSGLIKLLVLAGKLKDRLQSSVSSGGILKVKFKKETKGGGDI